MSDQPIPHLDDWDIFVSLAAEISSKSCDLWANSVIDRFHRLGPLREGNDVNFARVQYALDHCVRLYCGRVDAAALTLNRVMHSLEVCLQRDKHRPDVGVDGLLEGQQEEREEDAAPSQLLRRQRKRKGKSRTLVKSFDSIRLKAVNQDTMNDPLYLLFSSRFRDGKTSTLLLNSLTIDGHGGKVIDGEGKELLNRRITLAEEEKINEQMEDEQRQSKRNEIRVNLKRVYRRFFQQDELLGIEYLTMCPSLGSLEAMAAGSPADPIVNIDDHDGLEFADVENDTEEQYLENDVIPDILQSIESPVPLPKSHTAVPAAEVYSDEYSSPMQPQQPTEHWRIQNVKSIIATQSNRSGRVRRAKFDDDNVFRVVIDLLDEDDTPYSEEQIFEKGDNSWVYLHTDHRYSRTLNCLLYEEQFPEQFSELFLTKKIGLQRDNAREQEWPNDEGVGYENDAMGNELGYEIPEYTRSNTPSSDTNDYTFDETLHYTPAIPPKSFRYIGDCAKLPNTHNNINFAELKNTMNMCLISAADNNNLENVLQWKQTTLLFGNICQKVVAAYNHSSDAKRTGQANTANCFLALLTLASENSLILETTPEHDNVIIKPHTSNT